MKLTKGTKSCNYILQAQQGLTIKPISSADVNVIREIVQGPSYLVLYALLRSLRSNL